MKLCVNPTTLAWLVVAICIGLTSARTSAAEEKLNNFVMQYVDQSNAPAGEHRLSLQRKGWLLIRVQANAPADVELNGSPLRFRTVDAWQESMREVAAGEHVVRNLHDVDRLQVRRIPEIRYCKFQYDPWVHPYGAYDWEYLSKHMLPHVNTVVGMTQEDQSSVAIPWRETGGKWIVEIIAPGLIPGEVGTSIRETDGDLGARLIVESAGLERPWVDGVLIDEYYPERHALFPLTLNAMRHIKRAGLLSEKTIEPYVANDPRQMSEFLREASQLTDRMLIEAYNHEQPTEEQAKAYLHGELVEQVSAYRQVVGPEGQDVFGVCLGYLSGPPETLNVYPQANYRVFQDMEFHLLATAEKLQHVNTIMAYTSGYAEEETIRWTGRLFRHYCIEGRTERLSDEPYISGHLQNSNFTDGLTGWDARPAADGSITVQDHPNMGRIQGFLTKANVGDTFLVMTRSGQARNTIRQELRGLKAGRLYALRMYSSNLRRKQTSKGNPEVDDVTRPDIAIDGVEMITDRCFDHHYQSIAIPELMFFNYHFRVFRASDAAASVSISDWRSAEERGGNIGAITAINFVEVQPYFDQ